MKGTRKKYHKKIEKGRYWESPKTSRLMPSFKPQDQTAYFYYRRNRKSDHEIGEDRTLYSKTVSAIYKAIGELMAEHEGGVFLKDYGLFTAMVLPWLDKGVNFKNDKDPYFHTDGYNYCLQFFPEVTYGSCLNNMNMDRSFEQKQRKKVSTALFDGFRPKLYYSSLASIHKRKK